MRSPPVDSAHAACDGRSSEQAPSSPDSRNYAVVYTSRGSPRIYDSTCKECRDSYPTASAFIDGSSPREYDDRTAYINRGSPRVFDERPAYVDGNSPRAFDMERPADDIDGVSPRAFEGRQDEDWRCAVRQYEGSFRGGRV